MKKKIIWALLIAILLFSMLSMVVNASRPGTSSDSYVIPVSYDSVYLNPTIYTYTADSNSDKVSFSSYSNGGKKSSSSPSYSSGDDKKFRSVAYVYRLGDDLQIPAYSTAKLTSSIYLSAKKAKSSTVNNAQTLFVNVMTSWETGQTIKTLYLGQQSNRTGEYSQATTESGNTMIGTEANLSYTVDNSGSGSALAPDLYMVAWATGNKPGGTNAKYSLTTGDGVSRGEGNSACISFGKITNYIYYNPNGGSGSTQTVTKDSKGSISIASAPTRSGYTFAGWNTKADGTGTTYNPGSTYSSNAGLYLYAHWVPNSITFRYHPNGGSQPDNYVSWNAAANQGFPDSHWNYTNGTYYMTRHGYTATGYYAKADGSCSVHEDYNFSSYSDLCEKYGVSINTKSTTIDIYAQWSPNNYTVSFNANGGSGVSNITAPYESLVTLPTPTKAGYTFLGWQGNLKDIVTLTNGMEINDTSKGTIGSNSGYAVTEYLVPVVGGATYTSNYEVCGLYSYDANGNFIKRESNYATTHTLSDNAAFVRVEVSVTKGISFEEYQNNLTLTYTLPGGTSFRVGGNQTLKAQWSANAYTITFDAQGGTTSLTTLPVIYGSNQNNKISTTYNPTKTDYRFDGWYTAPTGGTQIYKVSNGSCYQSDYWSKEYDVAGNGAVWQYAGNVTLYAHWIYSGTSTITFDAQGGTTPLTTLTTTYGSNTNNRLDTTTNPIREGYTFDGWFDAPTGGTQVYKVSNGSCIAGAYWTKSWESAGTGATWQGPKDLTLYAHWIPKTYTVTWKNYDNTIIKSESVKYGDTPVYSGTTPEKPEDESFIYTFSGWSPSVSAITGNTEYIAQFTSISKRVEPTYTVTIPATANNGESFTVSATTVVLNTDEVLTVTLQSDFTLRNEQNAELSFKINDGTIGNNAVVLSLAGNGDKNTPIAKHSSPLTVKVDEKAKYSGTYTGTITFTIAVNTAEDTE